MEEAIIGIMVDVSKSMSDVYRMHDSSDAKVERSHAIITTIINIVKREARRHDRREFVFTCAFGLEAEEVPPVGDILPLLECLSQRRRKDAYRPLIELAKRNDVAHAERWIRDSLTENEALILEQFLRDDRAGTREMLRLIPGSGKTFVVGGALDATASTLSWIPIVGNDLNQYVKQREQSFVKNSDAYRTAKEIIRNRMPNLLMLKPIPVQKASEILDDLLAIGPNASAKTAHDQIRKTLDPIKPYIFGGTPMCKALQDVQSVFRSCSRNEKVLFILSDGQSTDGDPRDIVKSFGFRLLSVTIVTCYLTVDFLDNPKQLLYEPDDSWADDDGRRALFDMSSSMKNAHTPISYLVDHGWELPLSGESRLFVQANTLEVVDEFCRIVVSHINQPCDALLDIIEKVPLADYIDQIKNQFEPAEQEGGTCYANAIAAAFHLAMHRIVGRYGGYPSFERIRRVIIDQYGIHGANTERVLKEVCNEYRLRFRKTDERGARKAINERRALVARFSLYKEQWDKFHAFFQTTRQGILHKCDLQGSYTGRKVRHAVVLIGCDPDSLRFMNSWGTDFADGGFFRVEDENVLDEMEFFDIYWKEDDLMPAEHQAYKREAVRRSKELAAKFPSLKDLRCMCPQCSRRSPVSSFRGDVLNAMCPECDSTFKPTSNDLLLALYCKKP